MGVQLCPIILYLQGIHVYFEFYSKWCFMTVLVLHILNQPCTPRMDLTWSWFIGLLYALLHLFYSFLDVIFCCIYLCLYPCRYWFIFSLLVLSLALASGLYWLNSMSWKERPLLYILNEESTVGATSYVDNWQKLLGKPSVSAY